MTGSATKQSSFLCCSCGTDGRRLSSDLRNCQEGKFGFSHSRATVPAADAALLPDPATHSDMRLCHSRSGAAPGTGLPKLFRPFRNYPSLTAFLTFRIQHPL